MSIGIGLANPTPADTPGGSLNDQVLVAIARAGSFETTAITGSGTRIETFVTPNATRVSLLSHSTHIETVKIVPYKFFERINGSDWYEVSGTPMTAHRPTPTPADITHFAFRTESAHSHARTASFVVAIGERTESLFGALVPTLDPGAVVTCTYDTANALPQRCTTGSGRSKLVVTFTRWNAVPDDNPVPEPCRDGGWMTHRNPDFTIVSDTYNLLPCSATTTERAARVGDRFDDQQIDWFLFPKFPYGQDSRIHVLDMAPALTLAAGQSVTLVCPADVLLSRPDQEYVQTIGLFFPAGSTIGISGPPVIVKTYFDKSPVRMLRIDPHTVSPITPEEIPIIAPDCAVPTPLGQERDTSPPVK